MTVDCPQLFPLVHRLTCTRIAIAQRARSLCTSMPTTVDPDMEEGLHRSIFGWLMGKGIIDQTVNKLEVVRTRYYLKHHRPEGQNKNGAERTWTLLPQRNWPTQARGNVS